MHWWGWLTLWTVLVGGALYVHGLLIRRVWRSMKAFAHELGQAAGRFEAVADRLDALDERPRATAQAPDGGLGGVGSR